MAERVEWRLDRLGQSLALAELSAKSRSPPGLESPWLPTSQGPVLLRVFLLADGRAAKAQAQTAGRCAPGFGAVEVEAQWGPEASAAFRVWLGSRSGAGDGLGSKWGPVGGLFGTREELLAEAEPGPGGGSLVVALELEYLLGHITVLPKRVVWDVPIDAAGVRRARPGAVLRSRRVQIAGQLTRCCLVLKRKKHPGTARLRLVPRPPVPVAVRIAGQTRREPPYDVEDLADLVEDGIEVVLVPLLRQPDGWLKKQKGCVHWTVGPDDLARGDWCRSERFELFGGSAQMVLFPAGNLGDVEELTDEEEGSDEEENETTRQPASNLYVQIQGGRGGPWELWCGRHYSRGAVDPKECATSIGMPVPRSLIDRGALVVRLYSDGGHHPPPEVTGG